MTHQQSALEWLYQSCAVQGCPSQAHLQRDHRLDWAKTHFTMFDLLDLLCAHHHGLKTRGELGAWFRAQRRRPFVPPDDPRHPRHDLNRGFMLCGGRDQLSGHRSAPTGCLSPGRPRPPAAVRGCPAPAGR